SDLNFGRLAKFARSQWSDMVIGPHFQGVHSELKREADSLAHLTQRVARSVARLLTKYRQDILDMELLHQRIAWAVTDLYAMAAVISKLDGMLGSSAGNGHRPEHVKRDLFIGKSFCHHAVERITHRLDGLFANRDDESLRVADMALGLKSE